MVLLFLWMCLFTQLHNIEAFNIKKSSISLKFRSLFSLRRSTRLLSSESGEDLYVGIDCGTQGLKAVVYEAKSRSIIGVDSISYGLICSPRVGCAEQDPSVWVDAMIKATNSALDHAESHPSLSPSQKRNIRSRIKGIGVSGQQHGMVCLDAAGSVIRPAKLWCDTESSQEAQELSQKLNRNIVAAFTISKLLWLKKNEPSNFKKLHKIALPHDYLNFILTGNLMMEYGDASGTGLLDLQTRQWHSAAIDCVDDSLKQALPPLLQPHESPGGLLDEVAKQLGIPTGTPVSSGSGDNMMSALGCGCTKEGRVVISLGTSGTLFMKTSHKNLLSNIKSNDENNICSFLDATGGALPLICIQNCASVPEELVRAFTMSRDQLTDLAEKEPVGCEGLSVLPYLKGERTPNWPHSSGGIIGLREGHLARPGLLYRAALEGVAFSLKKGIESFFGKGKLTGVTQISLIGGGSGSKLWRSILSDALGVSIVGFKHPHSAALGAAIHAAAHVASLSSPEGFDVSQWISEYHDVKTDWSVSPDPTKKHSYDLAFTLFEDRGLKLFDTNIK